MNPFSTELLNKITSIIVKKFIQSGGLDPDDYQDMTQTLRTRYLAKKSHIESLYKGNAQPQTYMSSVIRMMMLEELRNIKKTRIPTHDIEPAMITKADNALTPEQKAIIENEKIHFGRVMMTMGKDKAKIKLCLKMLYKITPTHDDLLEYADGRPTNGAEQLLDIDESMLNKDIYARMCSVTNAIEQCNNKPDAIRIWLSNRIDQIIRRMNSTNNSKYDNDSLGILVELIYS